MLNGRRILLIIGGGIAAYKSLQLIRELQKKGAEVLPVMTKSAAKFVTPLSVSALSKNKVYSDLFDLNDEAEMGHIELSRSSDLIIVAPATANLMAKMAFGLATDLPSTLLLATDTPVLIAPAMNVRMWEHPATQNNCKTLIKNGVHFSGPDEGDMACGEFGFGRMSEPETIVKAASDILFNGPLKGKHIVITSGPTHEPIDPVRYIANRSSGNQGSEIANALTSLGAKVTFITGPSSYKFPESCEIIKVETAIEMLDAVEANMPCDIAIFSAAVSDWRVEKKNTNKIKKNQSKDVLKINFIENPDILKTISKMKTNRPKLVIGFAAETNNLIENATEKRIRKGCDWILLNDVSPGTGIMGGKENHITLISADEIQEWPRMSKTAVAKKLGQKIVDYSK
ncbi:bifunctional phosphopantothenoylcysteine decarboxylase/phosphopantothenate--cysteine ligase CoaBC [Amylibacter sp.]|nr:bifunctional phosphopantothenoylcysteine decarboxylase/phosphopantothenate--cysteine ligase CoaBC [Amylibacter sp.]MDA7758741.1 bifunctional phosphopantothenoylcysteine decarboxylase/phosphopantothenate--cysteine ligase CoaBC [Amylibacter sp.]MDA9282893.1 bifunctional phosphopantothenoylcysteine decarboxylase/phosphopantothenate--cysteine ligase CoaBC [Amylibacter sp.]MDB4071690.1 bifunctional phosphopantothenoylcysteine decarboxylase/phosphopantothenate--cysteine ligase CoaBC [Amylibacter sp|tara:strand:- start:1187 stop:2383 length:1197 start_codon:yes stop_codon:yes gene_type:complete